MQHTVQIDQALVAIGQAPSDSKQLIRQFYTALAEVIGVMVGIEKMDDTAILATASSINDRTKEIETLLNSN